MICFEPVVLLYSKIVILYYIITIHNLYVIRSLNELLKIVKFHSPISLFTFLNLLVVILYLGFMCPESNLKYLKETIFIML